MQKKQVAIGVTGAAGFIGSHLCKRLLSEGYKVIAVDDFSKGSQDNIKDIKNNNNFLFKKLDITVGKNVLKVFKNADVIIHLAAAKIPRYGGRGSTLTINTKGTQNILNTAKLRHLKVIFISTSDVYGKSTQLPFTEDGDLVIGPSEIARWSYAVSKIFDEHLCYAYWEEFKVPFTIIRLFGVYGPKQHRTWWGGPQALFIDQINRGRYVEIHGDGRQTRTFIYIDDVIDAITRILNSKKADNQIINIGSKDEISIISLAKLISKLVNKPLKIKKVAYKSFTGNKYEDVLKRVPDISKAKNLLGWQPKYSLEEGLKKTIEWQLNG